MPRKQSSEEIDKSTFVAAVVAAVAGIAAALIALGGTLIPMFYREYQWEMVRIGDCGDIDETHRLTSGKVRGMPDAKECHNETRNRIAVCWDGSTFRNPGSDKIQDANSKSWCAYKNVTRAVCSQTEKPNKGVIWECTERRMGSWAEIKSQ